MIHKLILADGCEFVLSPLTYDEFVALDLWDGSSDAAFAAWLHTNGFCELDEISSDTRLGSRVEVVEGSYSELLFNRSGEPEGWEAFKLGALTIAEPKELADARS